MNLNLVSWLLASVAIITVRSPSRGYRIGTVDCHSLTSSQQSVLTYARPFHVSTKGLISMTVLWSSRLAGTRQTLLTDWSM